MSERQRRLEQREIEVARREAAVCRSEEDLDARLNLGSGLLAAARVRDAAAEALDAAADERERELDLMHLLSPASAPDYGTDWPARRQAALDRAHSAADRLSARRDLIALVVDHRPLPVQQTGREHADDGVSAARARAAAPELPTGP